MSSDDPSRLFVALRLPPAWYEVLVAWQQDHLRHPDLRIVPGRNLHVTIAFLGSRPAADAAVVGDALRRAAADHRAPLLAVERYHERRSVAVLELRDEDGHATRLQAAVSAQLAAAGVYRPEQRPWWPHVTVGRIRGDRPRLAPPLPAVEEACLSELALYHSVLRRTGAEYRLLDTVEVG